MRLLNEMEQKFCLRILEGNQGYNVIPNLMDPDLVGMIVEVNRTDKTVRVEHSRRGERPEMDLLEEVNCITLKFVTICNLISLLDRNGYIITYRQATIINDVSRFGQGVHGESIGNEIADRTVCEVLVKYMDNVIVVTPEFKRFCQAGFISREEERFRQGEKTASASLDIAIASKAIALWAIGISIVTSLASIFAPLVFDNDSKSVKVDNFDSLYLRIDKLQQELHILNARQDSLKRSKEAALKQKSKDTFTIKTRPAKTHP